MLLLRVKKITFDTIQFNTDVPIAAVTRSTLGGPTSHFYCAVTLYKYIYSARICSKGPNKNLTYCHALDKRNIWVLFRKVSVGSDFARHGFGCSAVCSPGRTCTALWSLCADKYQFLPFREDAQSTD